MVITGGCRPLKVGSTPAGGISISNKMEEQETNKTKARENAKCIFPPCPKCNEGFLLPFSRGEDVFEK